MLLSLKEALADQEHQDSEFKTSTAETNTAARALIGFANSRGGQVFFGVTDAGVAKGIETGGKVIENLAANLDMHIYPSLPLEFDQFDGQNGKRVVRVWTPADKPPIVGGYVYSAQSVKLDDRVELAKAQAYRRVGRQTRKVDFMWLRGLLASDPLMMIDVGDGSRLQSDHLILSWTAWHVSGGVALGFSVTTDPSLGSVVGPFKQLPGPQGSEWAGSLGLSLRAIRKAVAIQEVPEGATGQLWLVIQYRDEWGCEWESRRRVSILIEPPRQFAIPDRVPLDVPRASASSTPEVSRAHREPTPETVGVSAVVPTLPAGAL